MKKNLKIKNNIILVEYDLSAEEIYKKIKNFANCEKPNYTLPYLAIHEKIIDSLYE